MALDVPNTITTKPDYVVGILDGFPVLVPVGATTAGGASTGTAQLVTATSPQDVGTTASPTHAALTLTSGLNGVTDNSSAASGKVGEYLTAQCLVGNAVTIVTQTDTTICSLALTAGDWDVDGTLAWLGGAQTVTAMAQGISTTDATMPASPDFTRDVRTATNPAANPLVPVQTTRVSFGVGGGTVYLVGNAVCGANITAFGKIRARRVR